MRCRNLLGGAVLLAGMAGGSLAATITVPDDNPSLKDAVAGAVSGDTIQVRPGTYGDRVVVVAGQDNLTITGFGGRPVFPPANRKDGIDIRGANGVIVAGFEFQHRKTAVRVDQCTGCVLGDLIVTGGREGLRVRRGSDVAILQNTITDIGDGRGIRVGDNPNAVIFGNVVTGTHKSDGIRVDDCPAAAIGGNTASGGRNGMRIEDCVGAFIQSNVADQNLTDGILVNDCDGSDVSANNADDNGRFGIRVRDSPPIATPADLTNAGNTASGNPAGDLVVDP